jgi:hypothetical protein
MKVLLEAELIRNPDKCKSGVKKYIFVGHHISSTGTQDIRTKSQPV